MSRLDPAELRRDWDAVEGGMTGRCPDCGAEVKLLYPHEIKNPPLCGDCWEDATVNEGDYPFEEER